MRIRRRVLQTIRVFALGASVLLPKTSDAQVSLRVLHTFVGGSGDGANAFSGVLQGADGNFYGTTQGGGAFSLGTVYRMTPTGTMTILHSFSGVADGSLPASDLIEGKDGNFYGTAVSGGAFGGGTAFRISPSGAFAVLHSFGSAPTDGFGPYAPLTVGTDGNFYGATYGGGGFGRGAVYTMTPAGNVTILSPGLAFNGGTTGTNPWGGVVEATNGYFYGVTVYGQIYRVSRTRPFQVMHQLNAATEGSTVQSALAQGLDGNLYGTTRVDGPGGGGTVFRMSLDGVVTVLHAFSGGYDGPVAGLLLGPDGNFYGTTTVGSPVGFPGIRNARVFRMTPSGVLTVLYTFGSLDYQPHGRLFLDGNGNLYGTVVGVHLFRPFPGPSFVFEISGAVAAPTAAGPFGAFDTPTPGTFVDGTVAVTGWALDDTGVTKVDILRDSHPNDPPGAVVNGRVFVGSAAFVAGARPDIESVYVTYPNAARAGWGYLLLARGLVWDGQGAFSLYAIVTDSQGNTTTLGSKLITVNSAAATKPFGNIDTPAQGGVVSARFVNFGWVLALPGRTVPAANVQVRIDGVLLPQSSECLTNRTDITQGFPAFDTSQAIRCFTIDSTKFSNGLHAIDWVVTDNTGKADGIGSRFFTIANPNITAGGGR